LKTKDSLGFQVVKFFALGKPLLNIYTKKFRDKFFLVPKRNLVDFQKLPKLQSNRIFYVFLGNVRCYKAIKAAVVMVQIYKTLCATLRIQIIILGFIAFADIVLMHNI
jgi:hypothetical protein